MNALMLPPVPDEPAPRGRSQLIVTLVVLVLVIGTLFRIGRPAILDIGSIARIEPPTAESLEKGYELYVAGDVASLGYLLPHAEAGEPESLYTIGYVFASGFAHNYLPDFCRAAPWLERAARSDNIHVVILAEGVIARMYFRGAGVRQDPILGYFWYTLFRNSLARIPEAEVEFFSALKESVEGFMPRELRRDSPRRRSLDAEFAARTIADAPPIKVQSIPDIPVLDWLLGHLWYNSLGCHARDIDYWFE